MMGELNVCFQVDTDNRENFPSSIAFQTFKKQRDLFYEIFRIWEENHTVPGWAFQIALGGKIWTMLTLHNDAINYYHLARLFKSQLLVSCIQNGQQVEAVDDESLNFLKALTHINPEKLTQLQKRFVTPLPSSNQVTGPSFPGVQEFFKDFILFAFNPVFYVHLENCLVHEIMELNDTQFASSDIEDSDTTVDEQTKRNFITCLSSLQLLAKVLGLVVSLPYRSESKNCKQILATQIEVRSKVLPPLNLQLCLHSAIVSEKLSLTIPWVVKYLAMMDAVSLRLPYYKQILEMLYCIYKVLDRVEFTGSDVPIARQSVLFLKSNLNWLFEQPNFPKDFCATWEKTCKIREFRALKQFDKQYVQKSVLLNEAAISGAPAKCNLDKLEIINDKALRTCCPPSGTSAPLASTNVNNFNSNKHITPVSSQLYKSGGSATAKHLELQLEEAFFHGQPASTRKTVDFVSERVASTCVKHICNTLLTSSREASLTSFRKLLRIKYSEKQTENNGEETLANQVEEFKVLLGNEMNTLAANMSRELKEKCEATIPSICEARVAKSIESLLAEDSLPSVKQMCVKIAARLVMERVHQWIQSHIVGGTLFTKDMKLELYRFFRNNGPLPSTQEKRHNSKAVSPTVVVDQLRALIWDMLDNSGKALTTESVSNILEDLYKALNERADLIAGCEKMMYTLSIDFSLFLVAYRTDLFTQDVQEAFIRIWTLKQWKNLEGDSPMHRILSPRNVMLLAQPEKGEVWLAFGKFIKKLLGKDILQIETLCDQCVALLRQEWPTPISKHLSKCLTEAVADFKTSDEATEKVKYMLGWIAETYHDLDFCDYSPTD